jgi:hypothetical protein
VLLGKSADALMDGLHPILSKVPKGSAPVQQFNEMIDQRVDFNRHTAVQVRNAFVPKLFDVGNGGRSFGHGEKLRRLEGRCNVRECT